MDYFHHLESEINSPQGEAPHGEVSKFTFSLGVGSFAIAFATMLFSAHDGFVYRLAEIGKKENSRFVQHSSAETPSSFATSSVNPQGSFLPQQDNANYYASGPDELEIKTRLGQHEVSVTVKVVSAMQLPQDGQVGRQTIEVDLSQPELLVSSEPSRIVITPKNAEIADVLEDTLPAKGMSGNDSQVGGYGDLEMSKQMMGFRFMNYTQPEFEYESASTNPAYQSSSQPVKAAVSLYTPQPKYPGSAVRKQLEAKIEVSFVVNTEGQVEQVEFSEAPNKYFARSIQRALQQWRFTPAERNGEKVESQVTETFTFEEPQKRLMYITGSRFPKVLKIQYLPKDKKNRA